MGLGRDFSGKIMQRGACNGYLSWFLAMDFKSISRRSLQIQISRWSNESAQGLWW
jgi:hypothetical protein